VSTPFSATRLSTPLEPTIAVLMAAAKMMHYFQIERNWET
jgi:hypothetical protein